MLSDKLNSKLYSKGLPANLPKENSADLKTTGFDLTVSWRDQIKLAPNTPGNTSPKVNMSFVFLR